MPTTLFSDNFNRANNTSLGANWSEDNHDSSISSNQISFPAGASSVDVASTTSTALTARADMGVQAKSVSGTGHDGGPIARRTGSGVFYGLDIYLSGAQWKAEIYRHSSFTVSALVASANISAHTAGDTYRLEAQGSALRGYRNGSLLVSGTDTNISAAGQGGIYAWNPAPALFDDFLIDDLASATKAPPIFSRPLRIWNRSVR